MLDAIVPVVEVMVSRASGSSVSDPAEARTYAGLFWVFCKLNRSRLSNKPPQVSLATPSTSAGTPAASRSRGARSGS